MDGNMSNMPSDFPGKDYLDYQALENIAVQELQHMEPRVRAEVNVNGRAINSLNDLEEMNPPYEFEVKFPEAITPISDLGESIVSFLESRGSSTDDADVIEDHAEGRVESTFNNSIGYSGLVSQMSDFITTAIRLWQTNGGINLMEPGAPGTRAMVGVSALSFTRGSLMMIDNIDEDNDHDFFDKDKVHDFINSDNPYISENDLGDMYAPTPEESPEGINLFTIRGVIEPNYVYAYGYSYPQEIVRPTGAFSFIDKNTYNNIKLVISNKSLFRILVAYMLAGAPHIDDPSLNFVA